jgi:hypothetical protein
MMMAAPLRRTVAAKLSSRVFRGTFLPRAAALQPMSIAPIGTLPLPVPLSMRSTAAHCLMMSCGTSQKTHGANSSNMAGRGDARPADKFSRLVDVVGTGIHEGKLTAEVLVAIREAEKLLYLSTESDWLARLNPTAESLQRLRGEDKQRREAYDDMAHEILRHVRQGLQVVVAAYGDAAAAPRLEGRLRGHIVQSARPKARPAHSIQSSKSASITMGWMLLVSFCADQNTTRANL